MKHRHINTERGLEYSVAKINSIIERGRASDVWKFFDALKSDPFGAVAENALVASENSDVYAYPKLIKLCLEEWRNGKEK